MFVVTLIRTNDLPGEMFGHNTRHPRLEKAILQRLVTGKNNADEKPGYIWEKDIIDMIWNYDKHNRGRQSRYILRDKIPCHGCAGMGD